MHNRLPPGRRQTVRTCDNIAAIKDSMEQNRTFSIYRRLQQLDISETSVHRIMHEDLNLYANKIQLTQELKITDHNSRRIIADWLIKNQKNDAEISSKTIFSDEAHFTLNAA